MLYWQISGYLGAGAERTLLQRAHYYGKVADALGTVIGLLAFLALQRLRTPAARS